jgi:hypothetical protein
MIFIFSQTRTGGNRNFFEANKKVVRVHKQYVDWSADHSWVASCYECTFAELRSESPQFLNTSRSSKRIGSVIINIVFCFKNGLELQTLTPIAYNHTFTADLFVQETYRILLLNSVSSTYLSLFHDTVTEMIIC